MAGKVRADNFPTAALVGRTEYMVAGGVEHVWIVGRDQDWKRPLKTILLILRTPTGRQFRPDSNIAFLASPVIVAGKISMVAPGIHNIGVVRTNGNVSTFSSSNLIRVGLCNTRERRTTGQADS